MNSLLPGFAAVRDVHPLIVHFPIALWSAELLFWASSLRGREEFWSAGRWILYLGVLSGLGAVALKAPTNVSCAAKCNIISIRS